MAEAEGLRLHLSSSSATGYKGVREHLSGRFEVRYTANGRPVTLGCFDTAVEAAVAYARAVGGYQPPRSGSLVFHAPAYRLSLLSTIPGAAADATTNTTRTVDDFLDMLSAPEE